MNTVASLPWLISHVNGESYAGWKSKLKDTFSSIYGLHNADLGLAGRLEGQRVDIVRKVLKLSDSKV